MKMKKLLIIGAGGHGRSIAEAVQLGKSFELIGFLDDSWPQNQSTGHYPILGNTSNPAQWSNSANFAIVAIGNNKLRHELSSKLIDAGFTLATIIHPSAIVSPTATIGHGSCIMAGAIIGTESILGNCVIVNSGANVDHHCSVKNFAHLGVNACMAGGSVLGESALLQAGSALGYGVTIVANHIVDPGVGIKK